MSDAVKLASKQRPESRAFRVAQRAMFKAARNYAAWVVSHGHNSLTSFDPVDDAADVLAERAVDFALAAAAYANAAAVRK